MAEEVEIADSLEQRLQNHAKAFESLMALTPAREYYGSQIADGLDPSEQWSRKKQTKEQKRAAKKAKLDPANQKSALDVMKERERKRKRELGMEDDGEDGAEGKSGEDEAEMSSAKRQKVDLDEEAKRKAKVEKRKEKRALKKEKSERKKAKVEAKKTAKVDMDLDDLNTEQQEAVLPAEEDVVSQPEGAEPDAELDTFDASGLSDEQPQKQIDPTSEQEMGEASSVPSSPAVDSPAFDFETAHSTASSSSSILPPSNPEILQDATTTNGAPPKPTIDTALASTASKPSSRRSDPLSGISSPKIQLPNIDQAELQERLRLRIEELRARRKADGPDGKPAKSRQELLDQRRKKEEQRKATKKEQRRKAKDDEQRKREEQLRGSGSPLSVDMFSPRTQQPAAPETNFSFSRLAFQDGTEADPALTTLADPRKRKGPQDPRTALEAAQKKQSRIAGLDAEKQGDIAEKNMWLNARKRAHGERVRDDTSLLKKALKRKEKAKGKSGEEWAERQEAVVKGREMKQKKRDGNLLKRREGKGVKGKKGGKGGSKGGKSGGGAKKGKGRPGFEGRSLKA
ncbi:hypothetical protein LTR91_005864 [Friedmanniomyces endolithicus]|uniref:Ribosomal RNA-processing protein 14/surfeit locus protein 6 C-terminal domain-containing protein n=1 Tax=Friedmanniomyces endolithicus TaxID=329885 RepID=A0AAN6KT74_9PEZI|nr:hypothetical protein LTR94_016830 [Friedmanniomyces endolithicus]KAK0779138.1 hypothetical protein LTR59_013271 [Friedmanniomyces endolithicus]KAK0780113.1 hypothetical protein LTR38_014183 [Friedmanniomyces endolithicus]KAK0797389.1 hypothetical protein LTR75_009874 [Friedmanniomyces endolithicus]KAK0841715.1 hypothetical protein LTR03_009728 [Friedmanniomyces endolithicus]